ncbi:hypothetical protein BS78_10G260300 [Paspalum vaginatum]|nr:hypothetical protein BS78_10G260300 [Paspalum vaginatum]
MRRSPMITGGGAGGVAVVVVTLVATISMELIISFIVGAVAGNDVVAGPTTVPALYVFGDSLLDVGNNNYLPGADVPRANAPYYGVDFPGGRPTGRFSNGYNVADFVAKAMGLERSPPAFLSLTRRSSSRLVDKGIGGVNYASGGAGILDATLAGKTIPLPKQVRNFGATRAQMVATLGAAAAKDLLSKSLFLIAVGTNDVAAFSITTQQSDVAALYSSLISNYSAAITELYAMGARKLGVINVGQLGCAPLERAQSPTGACAEGIDALAAGFDADLRSLLERLGGSSDFPGLAYSLGDLYGLMRAIIADPAAAGLANVDRACCGGGRLAAQISACQPNSTLCADRGRYLFWDYGHPTQRGAQLVASAFYDGPAQFTAPVSLKHLVRSGR